MEEITRLRQEYEAKRAPVAAEDETLPLPSRSPLRPEQLEDFIGQKLVVQRLQVTIAGALRRGEMPGHILISGPPGHGKTSLAAIIAKMLNSKMHVTSGTTLRTVRETNNLLMRMENMDLLFIDEIHRLPISVEEHLYQPMEDGEMPQMTRTGTATVKLKPFILVGATTAPGKISDPMRDRFAVHLIMQPYSEEELAEIVKRSWWAADVEATEEAAKIVAKRCKGVPRIALRLSRMVLDVASLMEMPIDEEVVLTAMDQFGVGENGIDEIDRRILIALVKMFNGGPVGVQNLANALAVDASVIEVEHEPYLVRAGLMLRESVGRSATEKGFRMVQDWDVPWETEGGVV